MAALAIMGSLLLEDSLRHVAARDDAGTTGPGISCKWRGTEQKGSSMYKCLSPSAIGVFARQSELLEIALTHRFKGLEIDIQEVLRRAQASSVVQACRYLCSAQVRIGGFELPVRWSGDEKDFQADLATLGLLLDVCQTLGADRCHTTIRPTSEQRPFHENFQFHVERLQRVAEALAPANVKVVLGFQASPVAQKDGGFEFIHQVDPLLLLIKSIARNNVGLLLDTWNWWVGGGNVEKLRALRRDQVLSVRLADIPSNADLTKITDEQRLLPGEGGLIDTTAVLAALEELGYDGPVLLWPNPSLFKGQKREAIVSRASSLLDTLLGVTPMATPVGVAAP
jgi:sugar phosphate isomerase/epimerase